MPEGYPVEGTVTVHSDTRTTWAGIRMIEWLSEHPSGDISNHIKNDLRANHNPPVQADFVVHESGRYDLRNVSKPEGNDA